VNARHQHQLLFLYTHLNARTASLAEGTGAACAFLNDDLIETR